MYSKSQCDACYPLSPFAGVAKNVSFLILRRENYRFSNFLISCGVIRGGRGLDPAGGGAWQLCRGEGPAGGGAWKFIRGEGPAGGGAAENVPGWGPAGGGAEKKCRGLQAPRGLPRAPEDTDNKQS